MIIRFCTMNETLVVGTGVRYLKQMPHSDIRINAFTHQYQY